MSHPPKGSLLFAVLGGLTRLRILPCSALWSGVASCKPACIPLSPYMVWGDQCGTCHGLWSSLGVLGGRQCFQSSVWSGMVHIIWGGVWLVLWHGDYVLLARPFALWSAGAVFCYLWPFGVGLVMPAGWCVFDGGSRSFPVRLACCLGWGWYWWRVLSLWSVHEGLVWGYHVSRSCGHTPLLVAVVPSFLALLHTMVEDIVQARHSSILFVRWS